MVAHVRRLTEAERAPLYRHLPEEMRNEAGLVTVLRLGFFRQGVGHLLDALNRGAGGTVAAATGVDYQGEGIESFLKAVFDASRKEPDE